MHSALIVTRCPMKIVALLCLTILPCVRALAQQKEDPLFFLEKIEKYRKMKNTAIALTVTGTVLSVIGVMVDLNTPPPKSHVTKTKGSFEVNVPNIFYTTGAACLGTGIPIWAVASTKGKRYLHQYESISAQLVFTTQSSGIKLTYRF
jgi:hypothetical protein